MIKKSKKILKGIVTIAFLALVAFIAFNVISTQQRQTVINNNKPIQQQVIDDREALLEKKTTERLTQPDFQAKMKQEARAEILSEMLKQDKDDLLKLQQQPSFNQVSEKANTLKTFLNKVNPTLTAYADEIVQLPRWVETVAVSGQETSFCTQGVASTKNNCGGVKNRDGTFKTYGSKIDSLKDISRVLSTTYKDKSIDQMNGSYCVDEVKGSGACLSWSEHINNYITKILDVR